jgi:hypothetical protein
MYERKVEINIDWKMQRRSSLFNPPPTGSLDNLLRFIIMFLGRLSVRVRNRIANEKVCKALWVDQIIKKPIKVVLENSAARREDPRSSSSLIRFKADCSGHFYVELTAEGLPPLNKYPPNREVSRSRYN